MNTVKIQLSELKSLLSQYSKVAIVVDENTHKHCLPQVHSFLPDVYIYSLKPGEESKTLEQTATMITQLLEWGFDRHSAMVALGGGMVCDITGFCASIYMRGIACIMVPTSLLAMTDAAIGGKTGVNIHELKNMAGTFKMPDAILLDDIFLKTLPEAEIRSGFAEMLKHGLIADRDLLNDLKKCGPYGIDINIINRSAAIKEHIVAQDPLEKGLRKILNFGHTVGHALETYWLKQGKPLAHGDAVALGMVAEAKWCVEQGILSEGAYREIFDYIKNIYESVWNRQVDYETLETYMQSDKKNTDGVLRPVRLRAIGHALADY